MGTGSRSRAIGAQGQRGDAMTDRIKTRLEALERRKLKGKALPMRVIKCLPGECGDDAIGRWEQDNPNWRPIPGLPSLTVILNS